MRITAITILVILFACNPGTHGIGSLGGTEGSTGGSEGSESSEGSEGTGAHCDDREPDDDEPSAAERPAIDDCDSSASSHDGVLSGPGDVDWMMFRGNDTFGCVVDPDVSLFADASMRLCVFAECLSGTVLLQCPVGTGNATSPLGRPGCCSSGAQVTVRPTIECPGVDDSAHVFVRVDQSDGVCVHYTTDYHYASVSPEPSR